MTTSFERVRWIGVAGAVLAAAGTLMPWVVATDESIGISVSPAGIVGGLSGLTVLVFAIIAIIAFVVQTRFACFVAAAVGVVDVLFGIAAINPSQELLQYMGLPGIPHTGIGVWTTIAGALVVAMVAIYGTFALRDT